MHNRIKELREILSLTQEEFGKKIGSARNTIANYENGNRNPSNAVVNSICREFNVNEEWLRSGEGEMFVQVPEEDQYSKAAASLLKEDDVFAMEAIKLYHSLSSEQRAAVKNFILQLAENIKEKE